MSYQPPVGQPPIPPYRPPSPLEKQRSSSTSRAILVIVGFFVLIIVIAIVAGVASSGGGKTSGSGAAAQPVAAAQAVVGDSCDQSGMTADNGALTCSSGTWQVPQVSAPAVAEPGQSAPAAAPPPSYTPEQQQAIDAAENYISDGQGFSKAGLIAQLHSQYGNGFAARVARFAVNHIRVNWRHQAVIAAKNYMSDGQGFSYSGLVQQLDSPYGNQFTVSQAEYAAKAVGL